MNTKATTTAAKINQVTPATTKQTLQRKCACGNHTASGGECANCAKKKLQRKLSIGASNDPLELEADRVADQVLAYQPTHSFSNISAPKIQRRAEQSSQQTEEVPASVERVLANSGSPLPITVRKDMEQRFEQDFSQVRVHTGRAAEESAHDINANAYTFGNNIVFNRGKFSPETHSGKHLLAHELTHVVQAGNSHANATPDNSQVSKLEQEARQVADSIYSSAHPPVIQGVAAGLNAPLREGPEDLGPATFGNLHQSEPDPAGLRSRVELVQKEGLWYERQPDGKLFRAQGSYDFVIQNGRMIGVKGSRHMGGMNAGHTEAAAGRRVEYAGTVQFGSSKNQRGTVREWSNASGHYAPVRAFASKAGLPMDKFKPVTEGFPEKGPQLPVFQPKKGEVFSPRDKQPPAGQTPPSSPTPNEPAAPAEKPSAAPKEPAVAQAPAPLKPGAPPGPPAAKGPTANAPVSKAPETKAPAAKPSAPPVEAKDAKSSGSTGRQRFTAPVGPSRPVGLADEANAKAQAKGNAAILVVQGVLAILSYFADKYQRERADAAWAEVYPRIQEEVTRTGRGVVVYVEYTQNTGSSVLIFEGIHWSSGGNDSGQPGSIRGAGQTASFSRSYVGPTEAQASITDETALIFRRDEARTRQRDLQGIAERMAKEGWLGRKLRERAGGTIDPLRAYDAKAHIVSASQSIKDKRYSDAANSLDKADTALDEMWAQIKTYVGEKKLKELSGED
jgi:hypothetical protein